MAFNPNQPRVPAGSSAGGEFGKGNATSNSAARPTDGDLVKFAPLKTTGGDSGFKDLITEDPEFAADLVTVNEHDRQAYEQWADAHPDHARVADVYDKIVNEGDTAQATLEDDTVIHALSDEQFNTLTQQPIPGVIVKRLGQDQESLSQMFDDLSTKEIPIPMSEARNSQGLKTRSKDYQPLARQVKGSLYLVNYPDTDFGRGHKGDHFKFASAGDLEKARSDFAKSNPRFFKKG